MKSFSLIAIFFFSFLTARAQDIDSVDKEYRSGGYSRLVALGNNPYLEDPYFILVNPAWGSKYEQFLFGDIGATQTPFGNDGIGQFVAANFKIGKNFTLGGILTRNDFKGLSIAKLDAYQLVSDINARIPGAGMPELNNNIELFGSLNIRNFAVGIALAYASTKKDITPAGDETIEGSASQFGINVGIISMITNYIILDVGGSMIFPAASYDPQNIEPTEYDRTILAGDGRLFIKSGKNLTLVPRLSFINSVGTGSIGENNGQTTTDLTSYTAISGGFGISYSFGNFLLIGGPGFSQTIVTQPAVAGNDPELTDTRFDFPVWNLGLEWKLNSWLVGRLGYTATTTDETIQETENPQEYNETITTVFDGPNGVSIGLGFQIGRFTLDAVINADVLRQGFNNIGGGGATFAYLSGSFDLE